MEGFIFVIGILRIVQASCNKKTSSLMGSKEILFRYGMLFEFASAAFGLIYLGLSEFSGLNAVTVVISMITAVSYVTEFMTALEAMKRAPLVLCNMCSLGGSIVLASINGMILFGERMTLIRWIGVALFFAVPFCMAEDTGEQKKKLTAKTFGILTVNFVLNGIATTMSKVFGVSVKGGNAAMYTVVTYFCAFLLFLLLFGLLKIRNPKEDAVQVAEHVNAGLFPKKLWLYAFILGATCSSIVYITTILTRTMDLSVLNTVPSAISIVGCLLVGGLFYREKITTRKCIGVVCGTLSVILVIC